MRTLTVYGTKNGEEKIIFRMLADTSVAIRTAKRNAAQHGYEITKVLRSGTIQNGFQTENATDYFLSV